MGIGNADIVPLHILFQLLQSLNDLRKQKTFCDVVVRAGSSDRELPSHKCVLAAVSNYFKAMFTAGLAESNQEEVTINGISSPILEQLLDYAYTAEIKITKSNVQGGQYKRSFLLSKRLHDFRVTVAGSRLTQPFGDDVSERGQNKIIVPSFILYQQSLLSAANLLEILPVRDACCQYLAKHMDENNSLGIECFAEMHACSELQLKAKKFSLKKFKDIVNGEEFVAVGQSQLIELVSSDDLECDREEDVFEAVLKWLNWDVDSCLLTAKRPFHFGVFGKTNVMFIN